MNFGFTGVAAPKASSSSVSRYSRTALGASDGSMEPAPTSKSWNVGVQRLQFAALDYLIRQRDEGPDQIGGADIHIQHSSLHRETHLDGFQVYFNSFAEVPFDQNFPWPKEIALNYFNTKTADHIQAHPDGALVSRQLYAPGPESIFTLLSSYGFFP